MFCVFYRTMDTPLSKALGLDARVENDVNVSITYERNTRAQNTYKQEKNLMLLV